MIRHIVLLRFREDVTPAQKQSLFDALSGLQDHLQGVQGFFAGPNVSIETHLIRGFKDAFWFDFDNVAARNAYLEDAKHRAVGARLVEHTQGGADGIIVVDLEL